MNCCFTGLIEDEICFFYRSKILDFIFSVNGLIDLTDAFGEIDRDLSKIPTLFFFLLYGFSLTIFPTGNIFIYKSLYFCFVYYIYSSLYNYAWIFFLRIESYISLRISYNCNLSLGRGDSLIKDNLYVY